MIYMIGVLLLEKLRGLQQLWPHPNGTIKFNGQNNWLNVEKVKQSSSFNYLPGLKHRLF